MALARCARALFARTFVVAWGHPGPLRRPVRPAAHIEMAVTSLVLSTGTRTSEVQRIQAITTLFCSV